MTALAIFASTMALVTALGAQSLLVNNGRYVGAFFNSSLIGIGNLTLYKLVPGASGWEIAGFLAGGPIGICLAMWLLRKYHRKPEEKDSAADLAMAAHCLEMVRRKREREAV